VSARKADRIGNAGVAIVDEIINSVFGWMFRRQDQAGTDHGVDAEIEVVAEDGRVTGHLLAVQIKTGKKYLRPAKGEAFTFYGELRHLEYWLDHSLPVLLILVDEKSRTAYWQAVREPLDRTKKAWKLVVQRANVLDVSSKARLADLAHDHARAARAAREGHPREELVQRANSFDAALQELVPRPEPSTPVTARPPELDVDVMRIPFEELIVWAARADFANLTVPAVSRSVYVAAAEHLFFREIITEHDAAKAFILLMLAREYGKAGSIFLHSVETLRAQRRVDSPSLLDLFDSTRLPAAMPIDIRLAMRVIHVAARRRHGRRTETLEDEIEQLVGLADQAEAWAVTAAAFHEARWNGRRNPKRALAYVQKAGHLRPSATGYAGLPFPESLDETWRLVLELTMYGVASEGDVELWLRALSTIPTHARQAVLDDEMNCLTIANRLWIQEAGRDRDIRDWKPVERSLQQMETWSTENAAPLLFAAARRARVIVRGEYQQQLADAVRLASDVPLFVKNDARATFILDEIVASQFVYARKYAEADVAFRWALEHAPPDSSLLSRSFLKATQAAAAVGRSEEAVELARRSIAAMENDPYRTHTDLPLGYAELALTHWFNGDRNASIESWSRAGEELFAAERNDDQWHGLLMRFHYVAGYFAAYVHRGSPPSHDALGNRFVEPKPGAFLIELASEAPGSTLRVRVGVQLILALIAEVQGNDQEVRRWSYAALDVANREGESRTEIGLFAIPHLIADGRFREAVDLQQAMTQRAVDEGLNADANELAASSVITPAFLHIAMSGKRATELASTLRQICEEQATATGVSTWRDCAEIIRLAFLVDHDVAARLQELHRIAEAQPIGTEATVLIANLMSLAASLLPRIPLTNALAFQAKVELGIVDRLRHFKTLFRRVVVPFFASYWLEKIESHPEAFAEPDVLRGRLTAALDVPSPGQPHAVLLAVARHIDLDS
jgi:tetratricopeptide (TPR) repeat protein